VPASVESPAGTAPSVLLIEEYDALAAAITSALKKFAPQHHTRAVESLAEAEEAAAQTNPQLFVIDFDPPHPNAVEFLNRISAACPDARVLVIASGTAPEFASERYGPNAIQFVEKPFELVDFGASVQALLGPWTEAVSGDSRGTLRDLNVRDLVPVECLGGATAILNVTAAGERAGEIHFLNGHICHALAGGLSGIDALHEILRWVSAHGKESERPANGPRTIEGPWQHVFLEALRKTKPAVEQLKAPLPSVPPVEDSKPATIPPKDGKKIVVIDDTEMLSIFVEDVLSIADPSLQIFTALTGGEGARRAEKIIPDLVLLDYSLPDLRGDQVCQRLLRSKATARIPVVIMSGHVPEMLATAERYPNVVATIAKPFLSGALVDLVKKTLARGPLPAGPQKRTGPSSPVVDSPPAVIPSGPPKSTRPGNGKKPVKQSSSSKGGSSDPVKAIPSAPAPLTMPAPPPTSASSIKITEPPRAVVATPPSPSPGTRDIRAAESYLESPPFPSPTRPGKLASPNSAVILGLGLEVISVQFTSRFQIGVIRARPSPATLSLTQVLTPSAAESRLGTGFELGPVELDSDGQIRTMRVKPTRRPAGSIRIRNGFDINGVRLLNEPAGIQVAAGMSEPMTMHLVAVFKVAGVELSDRFEVAQLILLPEGSRVRITLDPDSRGAAGAEFNTVGVRLDSSARIAEFLLHPTAVT